MNLKRTQYGHLTVIKRHWSVNGALWECKCFCGNVVYVSLNELKHEHRTSCEQEDCYLSLVGKRMGHLMVVSANKTRTKFTLQCDCGREITRAAEELFLTDDPYESRLHDTITYCGNKNCKYGPINKSLLGKTFDPFRITDYLSNTRVLCKCIECGKESLLNLESVKRGSASCENDKCIYHKDYYIHGKKVSKPQIKLMKLLNMPRAGVNYRIGPFSIDMVYLEKRIAIEYDGWFWHQNSWKDDCKTQYLVDNGWRVLRIRSGNLIPTKQQIQEKIALLETTSFYEEIILSDWRQDIIDEQNALFESARDKSEEILKNLNL